MADYPTRLLEEVGVRVWLRVYWGGTSGKTSGCKGTADCHNAMTPPILDHTTSIIISVADWNTIGGKVEDYAEDRWPTACEKCGELVPAIVPPIPCDCGIVGCTRAAPDNPRRQVFRERLYRAPDSSLRDARHLLDGDMFFSTWKHCHDTDPTVCSFDGWTNCDGRHLIVCVPNPTNPHSPVEWDVDSRANNCTMRDDNLHRCWVRTGVPGVEPVTAGKSGNTCSAGGGSIQTHSWHGMFQDGILRSC